MRHRIRYSALALALASSLAACGDDPVSPEPLTLFGCETGVSYTIGRTVNGVIDADDCLDPVGESFADYYGFTLAADGPVSVTIRASQDQDALVVLLVRDENELIDFDIIEPGGLRSVGGDLPAGNYIIVVAGYEAGDVGRYSVRSAREIPPVYDCEQITPLAVGVTINATISATDCLDPGGYGFADYYEVTQPAEGPLSVLVVPTGSRPLLVALTYADASFILFTQMTREAAIPVGSIHLPPGRYTVIVAGAQAGETGGYSLTALASPPPLPPLAPFLACQTAAPYTIGNTVAGWLDTTDCTNQVGTRTDRFDFTLTTARKVTIDLESPSIDPFLYLFNEAGTLVAYDDDAGADYNARIEITLPAGNYAIGASAYTTDAFGAYTLSSSSVAAGSVLQVREAPLRSADVIAEALARTPESRQPKGFGVDGARRRLPVDRLHHEVAPPAP